MLDPLIKHIPSDDLLGFKPPGSWGPIKKRDAEHLRISDSRIVKLLVHWNPLLTSRIPEHDLNPQRCLPLVWYKRHSPEAPIFLAKGTMPLRAYVLGLRQLLFRPSPFLKLSTWVSQTWKTQGSSSYSCFHSSRVARL